MLARTVVGILLAALAAGWMRVPGSAPANLTLSQDTVTGGAACAATLTLDSPAPAGGVVVTLSSSSPAASIATSVTVSAGQSSATFAIATSPVDAQVLATITAMANGVQKSASLTINPLSLASLTLTLSSIVGGNPLSGTITLTGAAPAAGTKVMLSSAGVAAVLPSSVTIAAGQTALTFNISTKRVSTKADATVTASLGYISATAALVVQPEGPASVSFVPPTVTGGTPSNGTVTLTGPAPKGGLSVELSTTDRTASIPKTVKVPEGQTSATFPLTSIKVPAQVTASITASYKGQAATVAVVVLPPSVKSIVFNPSPIIGGSPAGATLTISDTPPKGGLPIALTADKPQVEVPPSILIPAGKTTYSFTVKTSGVAALTTVNVKAAEGAIIQQFPMTILPPTLLSISFDEPTVDGGTPSVATVKIGSPAPDLGLFITLTSSQKAALCPVKIGIGGGHTYARFTVKTTKVTTQTIAVITATFGATTQTATLTIN